MKSIYFDVTDIVAYAMGNVRVSGIQRVALNIISCVAKKNKNEPVYCTFFHQKTRRMFVFRPLDWLQDDEFDSELLLRRLGLSSGGGFFPSKKWIRLNANEYSKNKFLRSLRKIQIYLYSILFRSRLKSLDLKVGADFDSVNKIQLWEAKLSKNDAYVILGANWILEDVIKFCKFHASRGGDVVQMIYDLIPYHRPDYCDSTLASQFRIWLDGISKYVNKYVCISDYTAKDLREFLGDDLIAQSIKVVKLAHEFGGFERNSLIQMTARIECIARTSYILCVGTIEHRKNGIALLRVWGRLIERLGDKAPRLIFVGKRGWNVNEFETVLQSDSRLFDFVEIVQSASDKDIVALYKNALFTVYPSLYEGWGLPVGEAAWFGKICITSNTTSLPEVCGDLVDYFNPNDVDEMTNIIEYYLLNVDALKAKEEKIRSTKLRTWLDVGDEMIHILSSESLDKNSEATSSGAIFAAPR